MMIQNSRRQALAEFLKIHRAALSPADVGLPDEGRRRTPGLRREEVAQLANISVAWYTKLEQAQDIQVSRDILDSIADALQLDLSETHHLLSLAHDAYPTFPHETISPTLLQMLDNLMPSPTYLTGAYANLVAWNRATRFIFGDFGRHSRDSYNIMYLTFTDALIRQRIINWDDYAGDLVGHFRTNASHYLGDPQFDSVVDTLKSASVEFVDWWTSGEIQSEPEIPIHVQHPQLGRLDFTLMTFQMIGGTSLRMCTFVPSDATHKQLNHMS